MNKKGGMTDALLALIIIVVTALMIILGFHIFTEWQTEIIGDDVYGEGFNTSTVQNITADSEATLLHFDDFFLFIVIGLMLATAVAAFWIDTHPAFFIVSILLLIIIVSLSAMLGNAYFDIVDEGDILASANQFPKIDYFMSHLPKFMWLFGLVVAIVLFAKWRSAY